MIYRAVCDHLEMTNRISDAIECFHQMNNELVGETNTHGEQATWAAGEYCRHLCERSPSDFRQRCAGKLEQFGDKAVDAQQHDDAITRYSAALSLNPAVPQDIFRGYGKFL